MNLLIRLRHFPIIVLLVLYCSQFTHGLYEDQVGKFDWHQKYFGHINFILTDVNQPKRILVGAKNNVVGAINSNSGAVLYRLVLEEAGELKYLGNYDKKTILVISSTSSIEQVKVRIFESSSGVLKNEWAFHSPANYATEVDSRIYLINTESKFPEVSVNIFALEVDEEDGSSKDVSTSTITNTKKFNLGLDSKQGICTTVSRYLVCADKQNIAILNLVDGSLSKKKLENGLDVKEIKTSGYGKIPCVVFIGNKNFQIFHILENNKNGPELLPVQYTSSTGQITLSQGEIDNEPVVFISRLENSHEVRMDVLDKNFQKLPTQSITVRSVMPIASLKISKGFCVNSRCGFVGFTDDELLFGTKVDVSSSAKSGSSSVDWTRQESLGSVLAVEMVDYPSERGPSWNPYLAQLDVLTAFVSRIKFELEALVLGESLYSSAQDRFGLRKVIVFVTSVGKVIGMDSATGTIVYSLLLPDFALLKDSTTYLYVQRTAKYAPLKPQASVLYRSLAAEVETTILYQFNPIDGKPLDQPRTYPPILQHQMLLHGTEATKFLKPILMMDINYIIHSYPADIPQVSNSYFLLAEKTASPTLKGYSIRPITSSTKLQGKLLWELNFGAGELLGVHGKQLGERVHSQGRVLPDRSVSYKYMNPNLVVVVTSEPEAGNINVFLVDAVSGGIVHSFWHKKARGPVHVVHSEHWIVYSMYSEKSRRFEITSIELYEGQSQSNSSAFSSFAAPPIQPIVVKQGFIFPTGIQQMAHTTTEKGITNKDVLIALPSGGVLELPRMILQPRLTQQHYVQQIQDEDGVILSLPYIPELPIPAEMVINYNESVKRVRGIKTWPTRLESTCLVLVHGLDLFYTRVTPSKTFDLLKDDFDHWFIAVVLAALIAGAYVTKRLSARKQLEQAWR